MPYFMGRSDLVSESVLGVNLGIDKGKKIGEPKLPFTKRQRRYHLHRGLLPLSGCPAQKRKRREKEATMTNRSGKEGALDAALPPALLWKECWTLLDGHRLRYLRSGSGPALLLLHGMLGYSFSWRHAIPALAGKSTVYAVDMPGVGFSDRPPNLDHSFRAHAERLLHFLDSVGVGSCDLLGTSHGGAVAMMAAALAPECVRSLILVAPVNPWSTHGRRLAPFVCRPTVSWLLLRFAPTLEIAHRIVLRRLFGDRSRILPGTLAGYSAPFRIPGTIHYGLGALGSWNRDLDDLESVLPRISHIPTLLLWGSTDRAVDPVSAERLRRQFTDCRLQVFEGVGHLPYEEVPEEFNRALVEFLSSFAD
jgi:pimeloyl-ACP methyl ester carboxylesterase